MSKTLKEIKEEARNQFVDMRNPKFVASDIPFDELWSFIETSLAKALSDQRKEDRALFIKEAIKATPKEKDTTPYSSHETACCGGGTELEGEDGLTECSECGRLFPPFANEVFNRCRKQFISALKGLNKK